MLRGIVHSYNLVTSPFVVPKLFPHVYFISAKRLVRVREYVTLTLSVEFSFGLCGPLGSLERNNTREVTNSRVQTAARYILGLTSIDDSQITQFRILSAACIVT